MEAKFINSIEQISKESWQDLQNSNCPFVNYEFFKALEKSSSACLDKGWQPNHLIFEQTKPDTNTSHVKAIVPLYVKSHSWGEYVFDWSWADAYKKHQLSYYPKLVATIPFTPVTSDKIIANSKTSNSEQVQVSDVFTALTQYCQQQNLSSWHLLFNQKLSPCNLNQDIFERLSVQFHWFNQGYQNFDQYLERFTARKRKNVKKERLSILAQGIEIRTLKGRKISQQELEFFYLTYQLTYVKRGHRAHLSLAFFQQLITNLPENILLLIASKQGEDIASSLFFYDDNNLYGRYWGCTEHCHNLHFELCYYQGIEFCIKNKLHCFNPGTQGEHKIQRGFEPILTYSYHWIKHPEFSAAIKDFCRVESKQMQIYQAQCQQALPFKQST